MSLRRVSLDNHVIAANKIGVTYTWRSDDDHNANSIPLLSRQLVHVENLTPETNTLGIFQC